MIATTDPCKLDAGFDSSGDGREDGALLVRGVMNTMQSEPDQLVVFSPASETELGHWTDRWLESACGQVVDGEPRLVVAASGVLRILLRDGTFEVPVCGTHLTPCPVSLARGTKYEGGIAVARHGEDIDLGPLGSDWIEIIRLKTPPSTRDPDLDDGELGALTR